MTSELITPTGVLVLDASAEREQWLAARRWRGHTIGPRSLGYCIGASDVPSILDLEDVDTPAHVWRDKVMNVTKETTEQMSWGHIFEAPIAAEWCRRNRAVIDEIGLVSRVDQPWAQATIDRRVRECPVHKDTPNGECLLEVKHMDRVSPSRWHDSIPDRLHAQMLFQLWVTGYSHGHYACKVPGGMKQGIVYADRDADVMRYVVDEVTRFYGHHLVLGIEPAWDTTVKGARMLELDRRTHPERVGEVDIEGIGEVMAYAELTARATALDKEKKAVQARLAQLADGAEMVLFADRPAYRYGTTRRTIVNLDALRERHPDAYADAEVVRETVSHPIYIDKAYKSKGGK